MRTLIRLRGCWLVLLLVLLVPSVRADSTYAVVFSGGYNAYNNWSRYYDETLRMWNIASGLFGVSNVYVLAADGLDPALDQHISGSSYVNSDWSSIVSAGGHITSATHDDLQNTLATLQPLLNADTSFYFWSFDHGGNADPTQKDVILNAWGSTDIRDDELASWVSGYTTKAECYAFAECFSGGMVDDLALSSHPNRFAAWAAGYYEYSWGQGWADAWADGLEAGLRDTYALGKYALNNDIYGPNGTGQEHPGYAGAQFDILTNNITPELPTAALGFIGIVPVAWARCRRRRGA